MKTDQASSSFRIPSMYVDRNLLLIFQNHHNMILVFVRAQKISKQDNWLDVIGLTEYLITPNSNRQEKNSAKDDKKPCKLTITSRY